jgi:hypothetical protein
MLSTLTAFDFSGITQAVITQISILDKVSDEIVQSTETEPEEPVLEMPKIDERFTKSAFEAVDHDEF